MKYFKFWAREKFDIQVDGSSQSIDVLAGSNQSKADAQKEAKSRSHLIEKRISSREPKEQYDVAIKEYITDVVDESNVISICRYGAKILNTNQYTILDLDDYPFDFLDLFKSVRKMPKKTRIVHKFLERLQKYPMLGSDFRIYETTKGIRVIGKKYIDPSDHQYESLMRALAVDWIYIVLSKKQDCYRARITPKPYRMRIKTIKIRNPLACETQEYIEWSEQYEATSRNYSVVKLMQTIGQDFSSEPVIRLHDRVCNAHKNFTLA